MAINPGLVTGGIKLIAGLFGKKSAKRAAERERRRALEDERQKFVRLREAAELGGFNPLTALAGGGLGGLSGLPSGTAPLASADVIMGGLLDLGREFSGEAAQQRARDKVAADLNAVRLEQARAELKAGPFPGQITRRSNVSISKPSLASNKETLAGVSSRANAGKSIGQIIAPGREVDVAKLNNSPGVFELENVLTGGPVVIPGDGEPWGIDEVATAVVVGLPQVGYNWSNQVLSYGKSRMSAGVDVLRRNVDTPIQTIGRGLQQIGNQPLIVKDGWDQPVNPYNPYGRKN